jgi:hypothetical protein
VCGVCGCVFRRVPSENDEEALIDAGAELDDGLREEVSV